jgi:hypothetical protein
MPRSLARLIFSVVFIADSQRKGFVNTDLQTARRIRNFGIVMT